MYNIHVTLTYPEGEVISYDHKCNGFRDMGQLAEGYLREDMPVKWVFIVTKEERDDH